MNTLNINTLFKALCCLSFANLLLAPPKSPPRSKSRDRSSSRESKNSTTSMVQTLPTLQQNTILPWIIEDQRLISPKLPVSWTDVRHQEGANCGYHVLKNALIAAALLPQQSHEQTAAMINDPHSPLQTQLSDIHFFTPKLKQWVPQIYNSRQNEIIRELRDKKLPTSDLSPNTLRDFRLGLNRTQALIDENTGAIKINWLVEEEIAQLLATEDPTLQNHIIIANDTTLLADPDILATALPVDRYVHDRIHQFQRSQNDYLIILWTERGFNHWVAYAAIKQNGIVKIYYLNSMRNHAKPRYEQQIINMLQSPTAATNFIKEKPWTPVMSKEEEARASASFIQQLLEQDQQAASSGGRTPSTTSLHSPAQEPRATSRSSSHGDVSPRTMEAIRQAQRQDDPPRAARSTPKQTKPQSESASSSLKLSDSDDERLNAALAQAEQNELIANMRRMQEQARRDQQRKEEERATQALLAQYKQEHKQARATQSQRPRDDDNLDPATQALLEQYAKEHEQVRAQQKQRK